MTDKFSDVSDRDPVTDPVLEAAAATDSEAEAEEETEAEVEADAERTAERAAERAAEREAAPDLEGDASPAKGALEVRPAYLPRVATAPVHRNSLPYPRHTLPELTHLLHCG